jgi:hypothetical protein
MSKIELSEEMTSKLEELIILIADEYFVGKPQLLLNAVYYNTETFLIEKIKEINNTFKE